MFNKNLKLESLSYKYKCIFVCIPKTAGTSIAKALGTPKGPPYHLDILEIKNIINDDFIFNSYFKFGFVRNPWDRAVSLYINRKNLHKKENFEDFIRWHKYSTDTAIYPSQKRYQLDWFLDENKNMVMNFVGKYNNLNHDWGIILNKLGLKIKSLKLIHKNKSIKDKIAEKLYKNSFSEYIQIQSRFIFKYIRFRDRDRVKSAYPYFSSI